MIVSSSSAGVISSTIPWSSWNSASDSDSISFQTCKSRSSSVISSSELDDSNYILAKSSSKERTSLCRGGQVRTFSSTSTHGKKIQKNCGTAWCMETRFQPVFSSNESQTVYSVFKNRRKPRLFFGRGHSGFQKPNKRSDFRGFRSPAPAAVFLGCGNARFSITVGTQSDNEK